MISSLGSAATQWVISLNLVLAGLRLGLKNRQVDEKWLGIYTASIFRQDIMLYLCVTMQFF
jgi:hypothetical protein